MTPQDRIKQAHVDIMRHPKWCAFSGVLACGRVEVTSAIPTACTDGFNVKYNPDFVQGLSREELRLLVLHENAGHKAHRHLKMWNALWKQDAKLANIAADHYTNLALIDGDAGEGFLAMPKVGVQPDAKYRGWSVQRIFQDLLQNPPPGGGTSGAGEPGSGLDEHDWEGAAELSDEADAQQVHEIQQALRQGEMVARKRGQGKGASSMLMSELLKPKADWRQLLREFVQETCAGGDESTWRRPNRRYLSDDVYMPSLESTQMGELVVAFDTSGSCFSGTVISRFVSELASIIELVKPSKVRCVYADTAVHGEQVFEHGQFALASVKPKGGGGTDLTCIFEYIKAKQYRPQACVVFTDGETPYGTAPDYPVLWCITEKTSAPWGRSIHIEV